MPGRRDGDGYNRDGICPRAVKPSPAPRAVVVSCYARLARQRLAPAWHTVSGVRRDRIRSVTVQTGEGGSRPGSVARPRRRDRHGRGLRGRLVPPSVPLYRSRAQQFDDIVLEAVARLEPRWEAELSGVEFAVQEVPDADTIGEDEGVPLARIVRGSPDTSDPGNPAIGPRIVLFRRPLLARAEDEDELSELIFDVVVEELAEILGVDPEVIDPGYGELG
jgi:predicted Zn-dependent protease with MMP-like domain